MRVRFATASLMASLVGPLMAQATDAASPVPGWIIAGTAAASYRIALDSTIHHSGRASGIIRSLEATPPGFGTLMQAFQAESLAGHRIRLRAHVRTVDAGAAFLWLRVDGAGEILDFANLQQAPVVGTHDWTQSEIVLDVPNGALGVAFGVVLDGSGAAWLDDVTLEPVGLSVPRTTPLEPPWASPDVSADSARARYSRRPRSPRNLGFEEPR